MKEWEKCAWRAPYCSAVWRTSDVYGSPIARGEKENRSGDPDRFSPKPAAASLSAARLSPRRDNSPEISSAAARLQKLLVAASADCPLLCIVSQR